MLIHLLFAVVDLEESVVLAFHFYNHDKRVVGADSVHSTAPTRSWKVRARLVWKGEPMPDAKPVPAGDVTERVGVEVIRARGVDVDKLIQMLVANAAAEFASTYYLNPA